MRAVAVDAAATVVLSGGGSGRSDDRLIGRLPTRPTGAQRAQKQYDLSDPENRLVTDELKRRWNEAMRRLQDVEQRIEQRHRQQATSVRSTREDFASLGSDLDAVWNSPNTDTRLKKRIARTLIHEVIVDLDRDQGTLTLVIPPQYQRQTKPHSTFQLHRKVGQYEASL